jgi:hypothetical protein
MSRKPPKSTAWLLGKLHAIDDDAAHQHRRYWPPAAEITELPHVTTFEEGHTEMEVFVLFASITAVSLKTFAAELTRPTPGQRSGEIP